MATVREIKCWDLNLIRIDSSQNSLSHIKANQNGIYLRIGYFKVYLTLVIRPCLKDRDYLRISTSRH